MFPPKFGMKKVKVVNGDVIERDNIEEFISFASKRFTHEKRSIVELTHSYDYAISCLVTQREHRFAILKPILQQMFLKLDSMERGKYGCSSSHVTKTPLFMLKVVKLLVFHLPMLDTLCYSDLFSYKFPMYRKWVRIKCV